MKGQRAKAVQLYYQNNKNDAKVAHLLSAEINVCLASAELKYRKLN